MLKGSAKRGSPNATIAALKRTLTWRTSFNEPCGENNSICGAARATLLVPPSTASNNQHSARVHRRPSLRIFRPSHFACIPHCRSRRLPLSYTHRRGAQHGKA